MGNFDIVNGNPVLWAHSCRPEFELDDDWADRWYVPGRVIPLLRSGMDAIVLPGGRRELQDFWGLCSRLLDLEDWQVIWVDDNHYCLDDNIAESGIPAVRNVVNEGWRIVPYCLSERFAHWADFVPATPFGDNAAWVKERGHKGILHRHIATPDVPALIEQAPDITVARGWYAETADQITAAAQSIGLPCFVKPIWGTTGEGIVRVTTLDQITSNMLFMGPVVVEEALVLDRDEHGDEIAPSVRFNGQSIFGGPAGQLIVGGGFAGGELPARINTPLNGHIMSNMSDLIRLLQPEGPGGADFLVSRNIPHLSDINTGRMTGMHPPQLFHERYAPKQKSRTVKWCPTMSPAVFWELMLQHSLNFVPGKSSSGIFPLCHLKTMWGMVEIFGDTWEQVDEFEQGWRSVCKLPMPKRLLR